MGVLALRQIDRAVPELSVRDLQDKTHGKPHRKQPLIHGTHGIVQHFEGLTTFYEARIGLKMTMTAHLLLM